MRRAPDIPLSGPRFWATGALSHFERPAYSDNLNFGSYEPTTVVTSPKAGAWKPHPDIYHLAAKRLDTPIECMALVTFCDQRSDFSETYLQSCGTRFWEESRDRSIDG